MGRWPKLRESKHPDSAEMWTPHSEWHYIICIYWLCHVSQCISFAVMAEPERLYTAEQLAGDGVSKKDLVTFLHQYASVQVSVLSCGTLSRHEVPPCVVP